MSAPFAKAATPHELRVTSSPYAVERRLLLASQTAAVVGLGAVALWTGGLALGAVGVLMVAAEAVRTHTSGRWAFEISIRSNRLSVTDEVGRVHEVFLRDVTAVDLIRRTPWVVEVVVWWGTCGRLALPLPAAARDEAVELRRELRALALRARATEGSGRDVPDALRAVVGRPSR